MRKPRWWPATQRTGQTTSPSAGARAAQPGGRPGGSGGGPPGGGGGFDPSAIVDSIFSRMDTNKDGMLSKDEIPAERAERFSKSDGNGDGNIDKAEMLQAMRAMAGGASGGSR